jgi:hypothetical protein
MYNRNKRSYNEIEKENELDEGNTPPTRKRVKCALFQDNSFPVVLHVTGRHVPGTCNLRFTTHTQNAIKNLDTTVRERLLCNDEPEITMVDLASTDDLLLYRDATTHTFLPEIPCFQVTGSDEKSRLLLAYLTGVLSRNDEVIVSPVDGTDFQVLIFWEKPAGDSIDLDLFPLALSAIVVKRYTMALDLDGTLINTRYAASDEDQPSVDEHEFLCKGGRYILQTRPGVDMLLRWSTSLFKVIICTNAIHDYAVEVTKILDPNREHLLKHVTDFNTIIKSREHMTPVKHIKTGGGMKDLNKLGIDTFECVILDDMPNVWKNVECLLPFKTIDDKKDPSAYVLTLRAETWKRFAFLHRKKYELRRKQKALLSCKKNSFSQENVLAVLNFK